MERIPEKNAPEIYRDADFRNSPFVEIKNNAFFEVCMQYPILGMQNAEEHCYVRNEVYDRLLCAAKHLPEGMKIKILDAWRPFALQKELYEVYARNIIEEFHLEDCTESERHEFICRFVSAPVENKDVPPVHTTGGAVDVTLVNADGEELEMGTGFDSFTDKAYTACFETKGSSLVRENRRLLYTAMINAGFTNLPSEWWHFDYGNRFWGFYNRQPAIYRGVFSKEEICGEQ